MVQDIKEKAESTITFEVEVERPSLITGKSKFKYTWSSFSHSRLLSASASLVLKSFNLKQSKERQVLRSWRAHHFPQTLTCLDEC